MGERAADGVDKEIAKYNQNLIKQKTEKDAAVGSFCNKYSLMKQNPLGACDDVKSLAESMDKVQARITNEALKYTQDFRNTCNKFNNESATSSFCDNDEEDLKPSERVICRKQKAALAQSMEASGGKAKASLKFKNICPSGESTTDAKFIEAVAENLSDEDQKLLKDVKSLSQLKKINGDLDNEFFSDIFELKNSTKDICKDLAVIDRSSRSKDTQDTIDKAKTEINSKIKELNEKIAKAKGEKTTQEESLKSAAEDKKAGITSQLTTKNAEIAALEESKKLQDDLLKNKESSAEKALLMSAIASLAPPELSKNELKELALQNIGEQAADSACDAQASNVNMDKNIFNSFDNAIQNIDRTYMGATR